MRTTPKGILQKPPQPLVLRSSCGEVLRLRPRPRLRLRHRLRLRRRLRLRLRPKLRLRPRHIPQLNYKSSLKVSPQEITPSAVSNNMHLKHAHESLLSIL